MKAEQEVLRLQVKDLTQVEISKQRSVMVKSTLLLLCMLFSVFTTIATLHGIFPQGIHRSIASKPSATNPVKWLDRLFWHPDKVVFI